MHAIIGTWKMSYEGIKSAHDILSRGGSAKEAVARAVMSVEDDPRYVSVGFGGLPDRDGRVTLDAAYMDGNSLRMGGVISAQNIKNPILAAQLLCGRKQNCLLAGRGAEEFALYAGLALCDMRTENALTRWKTALSDQSIQPQAYQGHDTVCVIALDASGRMGVGTSTSGLFMKMPGRVGDTPIIGAGFYCDARYGGAAATGLGEDIMRGCLSYDAVSLMRRGASPQEACDEALHHLRARMRDLNDVDGGMSLIALNPNGDFGASTTVQTFPFATARQGDGPALYIAGGREQGSVIYRAKDEEINNIQSD